GVRTWATESWSSRASRRLTSLSVRRERLSIRDPRDAEVVGHAATELSELGAERQDGRTPPFWPHPCRGLLSLLLIPGTKRSIASRSGLPTPHSLGNMN